MAVRVVMAAGWVAAVGVEEGSAEAETVVVGAVAMAAVAVLAVGGLAERAGDEEAAALAAGMGQSAEPVAASAPAPASAWEAWRLALRAATAEGH